MAELAREAAERLRDRYPGVDWEVVAVREDLVSGPGELADLVDAARTRLLDEGWDLVVFVTDLPLRLSRRPLLTHSSPTHNVALVSLPALGVIRRHRRLLESIGDAIAVLVGDDPDDRDANGRPHFGVQARLVELGTDVDNPSDAQVVAFLARVITGNISLLLGMILANRPWRLIPRLSRALLGALAAATFALITADVWRIAANLDVLRLAVLMVLSVGIAVVTLIVAHHLWERAPDPRVREQVALFNLVTAITVAFGIGTLYLALFVLSFGVALLMIDDSVLTFALRRPGNLDDYVRIAWLTASLATVGGALGGTIETDAAVREAAYAHHEDAEDAEP